MSWGIDGFAEFFAACNGGRVPYRWQCRLADRVVSTGRWPEVIAAPTGSGKSAVVDIHVYAVAATVGTGIRPPRRLSVVVNRRALVDSHLDRAERLQQLLLAAGEGLLGEVADRLGSLTGGGEPLLVATLRGGVPPEAGWVDDPRSPAVIAATPDMWGSRLLFRGYGTSRYARPREAGLLAVDSVMVLDEAHLNRQLLSTARDVAELVAATGSTLGVISGLQVVATTATPNPGDATTAGPATIVEEVTAPDLEVEPGLRAALTSPKPVELVATADSATRGAATDRYVSLLADQALQLADQVDRRDGCAATVLCVVNTVKAAVALAEKLEKSVGADAVACWVGRMRPLDLDALRGRRPGLFTIDGDASVGFLVATQTVEVGIDLDCAALVTELAPGSALAQRFGRVNRRGIRSHGPIRVVVPEGDITADRPPYTAADLRAAATWLQAGPGQFSPWMLRETPPPAESPQRLALSELTGDNVDVLAHTSDPMLAELDLDFWLRDDLADDRDTVGFILRGDLPADDALAAALLRATPPAPREVFPATIAVARALLPSVFGAAERPRVFCWRAGDLSQLTATDPVRPGDQLVLDPNHSLTRRGVVVETPPAIPETHPTVWGADGVQVILLGTPRDRWLTELADATPDEAQRRVDDATPDETRHLLGGEADGPVSVQVVLPPPAVLNPNQTLPWLVLKPDRRVVDDAELRQEWTPRQAPVLLADHQSAVAEQAAAFAADLGLPAALEAALRLAGLHHDDGKADPEFQAVLRGGDPTLKHLTLAKSTSRNAQHIQRRKAGASWRHEQLSAVHAWRALPNAVERDLVVRLVGTSHGRGRPFFPTGVDGLLGGRYGDDIADTARVLFETGAGWADVLDTTSRQHGPWGVAFLEAVLRGADCRVSAAGS